ncbi:hypothetical protein COCVIDRAFT_105664 [Bipolaris victoriae FI3]|uniref:Uncharacterized protein n=1 Tax=Bipolaris victoriae (strain FI3) TaxID=930091 RepID=W7EFY6_BIPV3|nr:hypothetical protein COCVIDRAFT_105664 [Bipolaris victoriae FI3]
MRVHHFPLHTGPPTPSPQHRGTPDTPQPHAQAPNPNRIARILQHHHVAPKVL